MSSSIVQHASNQENNTLNSNEDSNHVDQNQWSDFLNNDTNLSLSTESFLRAALSLKDQVVDRTWRGRRVNDKILDPTVYSGLMGTAFTCLRSYRATGNLDDLSVCGEIIDICADPASASSNRHVTFLCGKGGVYALGVVAANYIGDQSKCEMYLTRFLQLAHDTALQAGPEEGGLGISYDLLYGRAGFIWAALFINKHLGTQVIPNDLLMAIAQAVIAAGRAGACVNAACPLMYRWHGTRYFGAAHGLAGILHVLLQLPLSEDDLEDVKATLRYMRNNRFPHSGNYPVSEGNSRDTLVQWSHGATGVAITLCKASQVVPTDREFRDAAVEAGEVVWKSGLVKKIGLADGCAGNAYAFLSLFRLTGDSIYEERAKAFGRYLCKKVREVMIEEEHLGGVENLCSLFHGLAGVTCLLFDLIKPEGSRFPGYEI